MSQYFDDDGFIVDEEMNKVSMPAMQHISHFIGQQAFPWGPTWAIACYDCGAFLCAARSDSKIDDFVVQLRDGGWRFLPTAGHILCPGCVQQRFSPEMRRNLKDIAGSRIAQLPPVQVDTRLKVCVACAWDKQGRDMGEFTRSNREKYCKERGYALRGGQLDMPTINGHWVKIPLIISAMEEGFDQVMWIDTDAIFTNMDKRIESFYTPIQSHANLTIACDINGLNAGVHIWKNTPWSIQMLHKWLARYEDFEGYHNPEQTALAYLLYREPLSKISVVTQKSINAYLYNLCGRNHPEGQWEEGDFILHMPGISNKIRKEHLSKYMVGT